MILFWSSVCVFLRVTLLKVIVLSRFKTDCWFTLIASLSVFSEDIKKLWIKIALKMISQSFFSPFFFRPPDPKSENNSLKSTNKKFWPK